MPLNRLTMDKKLAELNMGRGRVIKGLVTEPISDDYIEVQIVNIHNPIVNDWDSNHIVKISKSLIETFKFI